MSGSQQLDLGGASLHWISGPIFEAAPQIPKAGESFFVLGGGTSPTDDSGHAGFLNAATLSANFTTQQVSAAVSLNVNGYNWFANGSGSLVSGTPRFNGTFSTVLIDGRLTGTGEYSGFFSAGAFSPDQLNGAGISYWLTDNSGAARLGLRCRRVRPRCSDEYRRATGAARCRVRHRQDQRFADCRRRRREPPRSARAGIEWTDAL